EASVAPYGARYHALRPHPEIAAVAAALDALLAGSPIVSAHGDCPRVQDPYSVRCAPQVLGASLGALRQAGAVLLREAGAVTDNPVLLPEEGIAVSGGHFHGQPLALQLDALAVALCEIGSVAERRVALFMGGNGGRLPRFLAATPGLESGLMIAQYLAAALVSENKCGAFPASVDSIPTSDGQEDHVSMGSVGALRLGPLLDRVEAVVALELLTAARALQFIGEPARAAALGRTPLAPAAATGAALAQLAATVDLAPGDRPLSEDLERICRLLGATEPDGCAPALAALAAASERAPGAPAA
ncbi:MAG: aromatic amino acid lyase, partial [Candidatus Krumholzibacteriia bacterium]